MSKKSDDHDNAEDESKYNSNKNNDLRAAKT
jgi:hypothetical protein